MSKVRGWLRAFAVAEVAATLLACSSSGLAQGADADPKAYLADVATTFVLENARLIDGTGAPAQDGLTIIVDKGRIVALGKDPMPVPAGAKRIDLSGHTVLPGLVMMHEHINYFSGAYVWDSQPGTVPKLLLAAGVTTARTAGGEAPQVDLNLKKRIDSGTAPGPRLFVTGAYLNGAAGGFLGDTVVSTAEEGRDVTEYWGARGATSMKVYSAVSPEALRGAVEEANRRGMHVAGHLGEISCTEAAEAGIHTIEHTLTSCAKDFGIAPEATGTFGYDPSSATAKRLIALLVAKQIVMVSTPAMTEPYVGTPEELSMLSADQLRRHEANVKTPPPWLPSKAAMLSWDAEHRAFERDFVAAGGRLLIGGDASDFGVVPGYATHRAMMALVRGGFSPLQVIKFATSDAASFLKQDDFGIVAQGKIADLLIVKGAPDRRIEDIRNVAYVFKGGAAYDPAKLRAAAKGMLGLH
jgi:imidazolonepropionase-like amidohydrolase